MTKKNWRASLGRARRKPFGPSASSPTNETERQTPSTDDPESNPPPTYPTGLKLTPLLTSLTPSLFLVALDRLILATSLPCITDAFRSAPDAGWYASFLLTNAAFQLAFGKLYPFFSVKRVFLASVLLFEAESAVCGAAGGSAVFIFGRALAGVGGAGVFSGAVSVPCCGCVSGGRRLLTG